MTKRLDQILVIDIEATCWEGKTPPNQESEIIEIGVCLLDVTSGERKDRDSILVKPQCSRVSPFCTRLTTLTQAEVESGATFETACQLLENNYASKQRTWASFGDYDRRQFERQCHARQIAYPFGTTHINVKNLLALTRNLRREVGLDRALKMLNLPLEGTHHRGDDDAWNIARILSTILLSARSGLGPA